MYDQTQGSGAVFVLLYRITLICGKKVKNESFGSGVIEEVVKRGKSWRFLFQFNYKIPLRLS